MCFNASGLIGLLKKCATPNVDRIAQHLGIVARCQQHPQRVRHHFFDLPQQVDAVVTGQPVVSNDHDKRPAVELRYRQLSAAGTDHVDAKPTSFKSWAAMGRWPGWVSESTLGPKPSLANLPAISLA